MEIKDVKQVNKNSLKLVFSIYFPQLDLTVRDFKLMEGKNGPWISAPSREYQDSEGKKKYFAFFVVGDARKEMFQKTCMDLLKPFIQPGAPSVFAAPAALVEEKEIMW
jgi:DNA-binding cell septation regulator SpoVG